MGANAKRGLRTQNEIIASKPELPVKNIKHPYSYVTPCYYITLSRCTCTFQLERDYHLRDFVKYLIIPALRYLIILFTVRAWSGTRSLLRALETERNRVRS